MLHRFGNLYDRDDELNSETRSNQTIPECCCDKKSMLHIDETSGTSFDFLGF